MRMDRSDTHGLDNKIDGMLASDMATHIAAAKADLERRMAEQGLTVSAGWKIQEELRDTETGTRWVFRPVHLKRDAPDLHSAVILDHQGRAKEA